MSYLKYYINFNTYFFLFIQFWYIRIFMSYSYYFSCCIIFFTVFQFFFHIVFVSYLILQVLSKTKDDKTRTVSWILNQSVPNGANFFVWKAGTWQRGWVFLFEIRDEVVLINAWSVLPHLAIKIIILSLLYI